jgi:ABC-2 type transport system ATP-binding protein
MISIQNLRVDYDDVCAVNDLSLVVEPGEVCGLIGPNGAGKSTTMRTILGLLEPTYGEVAVMGIDVQRFPEKANQIVGFMPDFPPVYEDLMVWEFLDLFAASYRLSRPQRVEAVERYIDLVGLTEKRNTLLTELSRGMRQRLMLAKTLIPEPLVLLLDEPASGVDPQGRIDLKNILRNLKSDRRTVLVSSHILTEMDEFCTSVAIMERGRLVAGGRIDQLNLRFQSQETRLRVEVLDGHEAFERILFGDHRVGPMERSEGMYEFSFRGDREAAAELLTRMIGAGVRVSTYERRRDNLEDLFLKVGAKEVS